MSSEDHINKIRAFEERLLDPEVRRSRRDVGAMLDDAFVEIGSSGKMYDKARALDSLERETDFDGKRTMLDFAALQLSPSVVLVTYIVPETWTIRSSIWRLDEDGWRMTFHQGTPAGSTL